MSLRVWIFAFFPLRFLPKINSIFMEQIVFFDWKSVSAEAILFCGAILSVLFESLFPKKGVAISAFAIVAMVAALLADVFAESGTAASFGGTLDSSGSFG